MMFLILACLPDVVVSDSGETATDSDPNTTDSGADPNEELVGDWLSAGDDLSPLFAGAPFEYVSVDAHFRNDGGYTVTGVTADDTTYDFAGTFVADETTSPAGITLTQTAPSNATALGIYQVDDNTLTYEVVQVDPDYGFTPPTPESGFGSTAGPNMTEGINTQVYRRQ